MSTEAQAQGDDLSKAIYIASKTKHAERWRQIASVCPVSSTWIFEAGEGETSDYHDLWQRCLFEATHSKAMVLYREPGEVLKGGWIELGAALAHGVPVHAVGIEEFTVSKHDGITNHSTMKLAVSAALAEPARLSPAEGEATKLEARWDQLGPMPSSPELEEKLSNIKYDDGPVARVPITEAVAWRWGIGDGRWFCTATQPTMFDDRVIVEPLYAHSNAEAVEWRPVVGFEAAQRARMSDMFLPGFFYGSIFGWFSMALLIGFVQGWTP